MLKILTACAAIAAIAHGGTYTSVDLPIDVSNVRFVRLDGAGNIYVVTGCHSLALPTQEFGLCVRKSAPDGRPIYTTSLGRSPSRPAGYVYAFVVDSGGAAYALGEYSGTGTFLQKLDASGAMVYLADDQPLVFGGDLFALDDGRLIAVVSTRGTTIAVSPGTLPPPSPAADLVVGNSYLLEYDSLGQRTRTSWLPNELVTATRVLAKPSGQAIVLGNTVRYDHNPGQPLRYYFSSTDAGGSWETTAQITPTNEPVNTAKLAIDAANADLIYRGAGPALLTSVDGGSTWQSAACFPGAYLLEVLAHPRVGSVLYALTYSFAAQTYALHHSVDAGRSWSVIFEPDTGRYQPAIALDSYDEKRLLVAVGWELHLSTDSGQSWDKVIDSPTVSSASWLAINPSDSDEVYLTTSLELMRCWVSSRQCGIARGSVAPKAVMFDSTQPGKIYSIRGGNLQSSSNFGATWTSVSLQGLSSAQAIAGTWYGLDSAGQPVKSVDGGVTWSNLTRTAPPVALSRLAVAPSDQSRMYGVAERLRDIYAGEIDSAFEQVNWSTHMGTFEFDQLVDASMCSTSITAVVQSTTPADFLSGSFLARLNSSTGATDRWDFVPPPGFDGALTSAYENCATGERIVTGYVRANGARVSESIGFVGRLTAQNEFTELMRIPASQPQLIRSAGSGIAGLTISTFIVHGGLSFRPRLSTGIVKLDSTK